MPALHPLRRQAPDMKILITLTLVVGLLGAALLGGVVSESRSAAPAPVAAPAASSTIDPATAPRSAPTIPTTRLPLDSFMVLATSR